MKPVWIVRLLSFAVLIFETQCETHMCFACRDSSSAEGANDCQVNTGRMEKLHTILKHEYGGDANTFMKDYKNDPYVQNCSALVGYNYCCVEEFEGGGFMNAYIRTCCDGISWSFNTTALKTLKNVQNSNDSLCQHSTGTITTTCVTMCTGNFCNGPTAAANSLHAYITLTLLSMSLIHCFSYSQQQRYGM
ncbi:Hypothetical predicted protein [Mytilus galloprovincialis]|uniref:Uncharacterized protein n=1 Tax=Mytilus galloprovincialis TaxID=29158 RepID=A0A8B6DPQ3_MYTGA|nr:Hypothetical predicted protein [Mytilus galloprovincialis]